MGILIKRKVAAQVPPPPPPRRRPGKRAGLSRGNILASAFKLLQSGSSLTIKAIADDLGVTPNSVHSRYPDGLAAIEKGLVRAFLDELVRSPHPNESWRSQLEALFDGALSLGSSNPALARMAAIGIGSDPLTNPEFAEQVLNILSSADLSPEDCPAALDLVLTVLCGALLVTCRACRELLGSAPGLGDRIDELPARRFPRLHECRAGLVHAATAKASPPPLSIDREEPSAANRLCQLVICELS